MTTVTLSNGGKVTFPDGTPPEVIQRALAQQFGSPQPQQEPEEPVPQPAAPPEQASFGETAVDMARVIPGGLAKGASYALGMGGDATSMLSDATGIDRNKIRAGIMAASPLLNTVLPPGVTQAMAGPTSADYSAALSAPTGGYYKPQTEGGRYVERGAEFAAGAAIPGSIAGRFARVAVPGALSRFGEDELGPYGGVIGALAGGIATAPRAITSISQIARGVPRAERILLNTASRSEGGAEGVAQRAREFEQTGQPHTFLDVGGYGVQRVARAAAAGDGPAQDIANQYHRGLAAQAPELAEQAAGRLTPGYTRHASQTAEDLLSVRDNAAAVNYAPAYQTTVHVDARTSAALRDQHGRTAVMRALSAAEARQDTQQSAELHALLSDSPPAYVSAGTLHRVQIAMRERAQTAMVRGARDIGSGLQGRTAQVGQTLEAVPELGEANAAYRAGSADIGALELGQKGLSLASPDYASRLANFADASPWARTNAAIGLRSSITDKIRARPEGTSGALNAVANTPRGISNIVETVGRSAGTRFRTEVNQVAGRLERASQNRPGAGSRTAILQNDMQMLENVPTSAHGLLMRVFDLVRRGAPISDATRADIQLLATSEAQVRRLVSRIPRGVSTRQYLAAMYAAQQPGMRGSQP